MHGGWAQGVESHNQHILLSHFHRCQRMIKMTMTHFGEVKVKMPNSALCPYWMKLANCLLIISPFTLCTITDNTLV